MGMTGTSTISCPSSVYTLIFSYRSVDAPSLFGRLNAHAVVGERFDEVEQKYTFYTERPRRRPATPHLPVLRRRDSTRDNLNNATVKKEDGIFLSVGAFEFNMFWRRMSFSSVGMSDKQLPYCFPFGELRLEIDPARLLDSTSYPRLSQLLSIIVVFPAHGGPSGQNVMRLIDHAASKYAVPSRIALKARLVKKLIGSGSASSGYHAQGPVFSGSSCIGSPDFQSAVRPICT